MSVGYGRAWEIASSVPLADHGLFCAYQATIGVVLCDCEVLTSHPEYTDSAVHGRGGAVVAVA